MRKLLTLILLLGIIISITIGGCIDDKVDIEDDFSITYSDQEAKTALDFALSRVGKPYVWGGNGPDGFDCSGLIVWSYQQVNPGARFKIGNNYYPDAAMDDLYNFNTTLIKPSKLRPGDIVFITHDPDRITHGGLFIKWLNNNTFQFIHATSTDPDREVIIDVWEIDKSGYNYQWFVEGGRLKKY